MKLFTIKHKATGEFFKGFNKQNNPVWTTDKSKAWKNEKAMAVCQGILLAKFGGQKKPVAL